MLTLRETCNIAHKQIDLLRHVRPEPYVWLTRGWFGIQEKGYLKARSNRPGSAEDITPMREDGRTLIGLHRDFAVSSILMTYYTCEHKPS